MTRLPNRNYSRDYKSQLLAEFKSSNKSYKEFASENDIPWRTLYDWINRPGRTYQPKKNQVSHLPLYQ